MARTSRNASRTDRHAHPALVGLTAWLFPGSGFFLQKDTRTRWRGLVLAILIYLTFLIGIVLEGGVVWPIWSMRALGFNIIGVLTFLVQLGAGWPALLSLAAYAGDWPLLSPDAAGAYHELGGLYILSAGALNYHIIRQSLDSNRRKAFEVLAQG